MQQLKIKNEKGIWKVLGDYGVFIAFIILFIVNSLFTKNFLSITTIQNILSQCATTVFLGVGMTVVIATGGINISVGSVMAVSAMIAAKFIKAGYMWQGMVFGLGVAIICGAVTGYVIIKFDVQPMIASLSMMFILRGIAKLLNDGKNMNPGNRELNNFLYEMVGPISVRTVMWFAIVIVIFVLVAKTRFGICIESYGDNGRAARIAGINVTLIITASYIICNILACIAGYIEMGYSSIVDPGNMGLTKEMDAIAATVLGGTSIDGGKTHIWGTVCGAIVLQMITIMVNMNNISSSYAKIIKAGIIILAVFLQNVKKTRRG